MACCTFVRNCGRWQLYATTTGTGVQYFRIYSKLCNLMCQSKIIVDVVSTGATAADTATITTNCGGVIPLVKASDLTDVTVANLPAGTSIQVVVKTVNQIPQGVVLGL